MATIKEVAIASGVSASTVSRILASDTWGKEETRKKVLKAIKELQYKPNGLARQLRTQETKTIIVIIPDLSNTIFHEIAMGIEAEADANGYHVLIADTKGQASLEKYYLNAIQQHEYDGIISMSANVTRKLLEQIAGEYPLVMALQSIQDSQIPTVSIDNVAAATAAMKHLIRLGHKKIAHITSSSDIGVYKDRLNAYMKALVKNELAVDPQLIRSGTSTILGGFEMADQLISSGKAFTAIFAAGDTMALGAISALRQRGIRVPEDVAVVGFDDLEVSSYYNPPLTTIRQPKHMIGQYAFRKLLTIMKGESVSNPIDILPYELVIRESCGHFL